MTVASCVFVQAPSSGFLPPLSSHKNRPDSSASGRYSHKLNNRKSNHSIKKKQVAPEKRRDRRQTSITSLYFTEDRAIVVISCWIDCVPNMVQIWYMEAYPWGDPRLPHHMFPPKKITPDELTKRTGTLYFKIDTADQVAMSKRIALLKLERNLTKEDTYTLDAETTIDFEEKIEELFEESELSSESARLIIEGSAYYDIEDDSGNWLRILCEYGDLLILPAGKLYRFTTTPTNFVRMRRFFKGDIN